jgi:FtsH-binding integral membrane protein
MGREPLALMILVCQFGLSFWISFYPLFSPLESHYAACMNCTLSLVAVYMSYESLAQVILSCLWIE